MECVLGVGFSWEVLLKFCLFHIQKVLETVSGVVSINTLVNMTAYYMKTQRNVLNSYTMVMTKVGEMILG